MQDTAETERLEQALLTYARQQGASRWDLRALGLAPAAGETQLFHRSPWKKPQRRLFQRDGTTTRPQG